MTTASSPRVSVIIPTRNRPARLAVAIESVLHQDYADTELVVVDDGSDPPVRLPSRDGRITLIRVERSVGPAAARNLGLDRASGAFLSFLDDDDYYYPNKLGIQLRYLLEHPHVDLVFSRVRVIQAGGGEGFSLPMDYEHDPIENLRMFNVIHTNSALFRRDLARRCRFDERLTMYTDTQFFLSASFRCTAHYLPVEVAVWHRGDREDQVTRAGLASAHRNLTLICEIFEEQLGRHPEIRSEYLEMLEGLELELWKARLLG